MNGDFGCASLPASNYFVPNLDISPLRTFRVQSLASLLPASGRALIHGPGIKERDLLKPIGESLALPNGLTVRGTLLREKILKLWLYNAKLPERKGFKALDYYAYDSRGVITGTFRRNEQPVATSYLDSREQAGIMYLVGTLQARIEGKTYDLKTYSYRNKWNKISALLLLLRDGTSGKTTYGGGRVVDIHIAKG